jgi:hypothetical protein
VLILVYVHYTGITQIPGPEAITRVIASLPLALSFGSLFPYVRCVL